MKIMKRRPWRLVHPFQRRYASWIGGLLFSYSIVVFGLAIIAPYIVPAFKLSSQAPLASREHAADQFLFLAEALWPAVFALIIGAVVFTVYVTNRLAGPLYRLDQFVKDVGAGDLSQRLHLRQGDELLDLANDINACVDRFDQTLGEIRGRATRVQGSLQEILRALEAQAGVPPDWLPSLEAAHKDSRSVEELISVIQLSDAN